MNSAKLRLDMQCGGMETLPQIPPCFLMSGPFSIRKPVWCQSPCLSRHMVFEEILTGRSKDISNEPFYFIGRNERADIVLDDLMVSRCHAVLMYNGNGDLYLIDLGSSHGSFIGSVKVTPYTPTLIKKTSIIKFGSWEKQYVLREYPKVNKVLETSKSLKSIEEQAAYLNAFHNRIGLSTEQLAHHKYLYGEHESDSSGCTDQSESHSEDSGGPNIGGFVPDSSTELYRRDTVDYTDADQPWLMRGELRRSYSLDFYTVPTASLSRKTSHDECDLSSPLGRKKVRFSDGDLSVFAEEAISSSTQHE